MNLAEALGDMITNYETLGKQVFLLQRGNYASMCLGYINDAYTNGVIEENKEKLRRQVEELQKQITEKNDNYTVILAENDELRKEQEASNNRITELTRIVENLTEENEELHKKVEWWEKESGRVNTNDGTG